MKVRKLLALVLTLLLVFAYGAFAAEGEAQEPGQQTAAQPAQQEAAATQAFERSLTAKGLFLWRWNWLQANNTNHPAAAGTMWDRKFISNQVWQAAVVALDYKISPELRINATLYHQYRWGDGAGDGRSATNAFNPSSGTFPDGFYYLGAGGAAQKNTILLEQISMTWTPGGFFNELTVGRIQNSWGYAGGLMLGARAGTDRFLWVGKTKLFGYLALPLFLLELRSDKSTAIQGDERLILQPGIVLVGPGKFIEVLGLTFAHDGLRKRVSGDTYNASGARTAVGDSNAEKSASYSLLALSMKMRMGSLMVINFEFVGTLGRWESTTTHTRNDMAKIFLNAEINLGMITITPEFAFLTAPNKDYSAAGTVNHDAINTPFATQFYSMGGFLMSGNPLGYGAGGKLGLFVAALKAEFKLLGGSLIPWIKMAWGTTVSKYVNTATGTFKVSDIDDLRKAANYDPISRSLGFEIDLGVKVAIADGLNFSIEFGVLFLPKSISGSDSDPQWGALGIVLNDYSGFKSVFGINVRIDLKF